jgi:chromosomal replication initiator protein
LFFSGRIAFEGQGKIVITRTAQEIWDAALGELQLQVSKANYRTWLEKTKGLSYRDSQLLIGVPNAFVAEYLDKNLRSLIEKTLIGITGREVKVSFTIDNLVHTFEAKSAELADPAPTMAIPFSANLTRLNPKYTFGTFVVSDCNRLAHAAAAGVSEQPGLSTYNPLYIYGGVGLGKTHLLNAIGNAALSKHIRVVYVSAEQYTNEFVNALRERKTDNFRNKYRNADMLLIDDIQFISGKEQTEESFFHIFNELRDADRQIALTSNCPPHSIPLIEERLRSRLEWGLSAGIQPPDFQTRLAILSAKANKDGIVLNADVLELIAERIQQNIRELEGSLNRVVAYAKLLRTAVTPEMARKALEDIATKQTKTPPSPALLLETVAIYFNLDVQELKGNRRDKEVCLARQIAMYLMREQTDFSLSRIGRELGGRQPIIVSQAHKKISENISNDPALKQTVTDIERRLSP